MTIDISLIVVILNFFLLLIILNRLLYKPLRGFLSDRQKQIQKDLDEASASIEAAKQLEQQKEAELKQAMLDAQNLQNRIRSDAEFKAEEIVNAAKKTEIDIIKHTENKIQSLTEEAKIKLETHLSEIITHLTSKVLHEKIDSEKDKELIARLIAERQAK